MFKDARSSKFFDCLKNRKHRPNENSIIPKGTDKQSNIHGYLEEEKKP